MEYGWRRYNTPFVRHSPLLCFDLVFEVAKFKDVKNKALSKRLLYVNGLIFRRPKVIMFAKLSKFLE